MIKYKELRNRKMLMVMHNGQSEEWSIRKRVSTRMAVSLPVGRGLELDCA